MNTYRALERTDRNNPDRKQGQKGGVQIKKSGEKDDSGYHNEEKKKRKE